jgi:hypothetical protein
MLRQLSAVASINRRQWRRYFFLNLLERKKKRKEVFLLLSSQISFKGSEMPNYRYVLLVSCLLLSGAGSYQGLISWKQKLLVPLLCSIAAALCLDKSPLRDRAMGLMFAALAYVFFKTHQVAFFLRSFG